MMEEKSTQNLFSLEGKLAFITGGGSGIGLAIAKAFISSGARVIIAGRREEVLQEACNELGENSGYEIIDVTDFSRMPGLSKRVIAHYGRPVNVLVNNAGIHLKKFALETSPEEFENVLRTNLTGAHALNNELLPDMIEGGGGSILMISSMAAIYGIPQVIAYSAAKSGMAGMVRTLAIELGPRGVRVNALAPGFIETAISQKAMSNDPKRKEKVLSRTPLGRFGLPAEVAAAAVFLSSDAASYITGATLAVDGGNSIGF